MLIHNKANLGENRYPTEPIYAPNPQNPDHGWVITVVYDGKSHSSEVWVWGNGEWGGGEIFFFIHKTSRKVNIIRNAIVKKPPASTANPQFTVEDRS
ncbi:MAG: carotenoid oxygenase family protein [Stigonema ocellatum SAG 48.90 = DSM 106950]|nr:carotenoid oxygenase family protein [Stigonema ocellatum SAG 48.90 = DSM 106950]